MELLAPVHSVGDEEVAHLDPSEVKDVRPPVGMLSALGVGMFVQRGAVKPGQCPGVLGEVGRDPIDEHADPGTVEVIDEVTQVIG